MSRTYRSYDVDGSPGAGPLSLTAFAGGGEPGTKSKNVQVTIGRNDYVALLPKEIETICNGLEKRSAVKVEGAGTAEPLRVRSADQEDYEVLISMGAPDGVADVDAGTFVRLTEPQVEDLIEALNARLEGEDWASSSSWESFYRIDENGNQTEMYEIGVTMAEHEREQGEVA